MDLKKNVLVPLRIPSGWRVVSNSFFDIEPHYDLGIFHNAEYFTQDLLSIERIQYDPKCRPLFIIDLGWYPSEDIDGKYRLTLVSKSFENKLKIIENKNRDSIRKLIEAWLKGLSRCENISHVDSILAAIEVD